MASGDTLQVFLPYQNETTATAFAQLDLRNVHPCLDFDAATDEEAVFTGIMARNYAGGGITATVVWSATSATSGTVRWEIMFERIDAGTLDIDADSFAASQSAGGTANATSGVTTYTAVTFTNGAQMDSVAAGEAFRLKVRRDANGTTGTDDATGDAELLAVELKET